MSNSGIKNMKQKDELEVEKLSLEIKTLKRPIRTKLIEWIPSIILLALLVPLANHLYWKEQKQFEIEKMLLQTKIELFTKSCRIFSSWSQLLSRVNEIEEEIFTLKKGKSGNAKRLLEMERIYQDLENKRLDIEPQVSECLSNIRMLFGEKVREKLKEFKKYYDEIPEGQHIDVRCLFEKCELLTQEMEREIRNLTLKNNTTFVENVNLEIYQLPATP